MKLYWHIGINSRVTFFLIKKTSVLITNYIYKNNTILISKGTCNYPINTKFERYLVLKIGKFDLALTLNIILNMIILHTHKKPQKYRE